MTIYAVGLGPGDPEYLAPMAREAILGCEVIAGYDGYMGLIPDLTRGKELISTGMRGETDRCAAAVSEALAGRRVAVVSGGDSGIYGMASLLYELTESEPSLDIEVIPGITAATSAAAVLGSPLGNDFAAISLSDLLTPWDVIEKRLEACGAADMVICLYNPKSRNREDRLEKACNILLKRLPPDTVCGYVRNAFRGGDKARAVCGLAALPFEEVNMFTTVIIGNSATRLIKGKMVTARGYLK